MAVLSRLLIGSQQRIDLADFLSVQSYVASDFREMIRTFVGNNPLILKGFEIANAPQSIGTTSVSITVADSVLYDSTATAGSFFSGLPEGNTLSQPIVLGQELRTGVTNYIYVTLSTIGAAPDTRAFWDVDLNGGEGGEFNQVINTEAVLVIEAGVSTAGFPQGTIPIAKVGMNSSSITDITDCRNLMYRLGTGGTSPDPNNRFQFPPLPEPQYARSEPPSIINSSSLPNPFQGGDKNIQTLKEWMDAVMTKLVELSGTTYWYESTGDLSLIKVYDDALGSSLKSKGKWIHDENSIGLVTWTDDIIYSKMNDPRDIIMRAGSKTLQNNQVMWIQMVRNQKINALDTAVTFVNGASYVNGAVGSFQYLNKGDWIKQKGDSEYHYARVVGFYTTANGTGTETNTPSDAISVKLEGAYTGSAGVSSAVYTKGVYTSSDIQVDSRNSIDIYDAGGDMYWLATRLDTIETVSSIAIRYETSVAVDKADGVNANVTFGTAHNLISGDRIVLAGATAFDGVYQVEVIDSTTVTIATNVTGTTSSATASWALITSGSRNAVGSSFQVESANHGLASGQKVSISNVTPILPYNINGDYLVNVRSDTVFQIAYSGGTFSPNIATATITCAKVILKTNLGAVEVVQGEEININEPDTENLLGFIGMGSLAETHPLYVVPNATNNMVYGYSDFNSSGSDSLTTRASRLTAMMADRVQDRDLVISGRSIFRNTTSGSNQVIDVSGSTLTVSKPGSPSQTINLSSSYTLAANTALVIDIDRNGSGAISPSVVSFDETYLLRENRLVLLSRASGTSIYTWDGSSIPNSGSWTCNDNETSQNRNIIVNEQVTVDYYGGKLNFRSPSGYVYILIPGSSAINMLDVSNFTSGIAISTDESAWVRVNRAANKTFTNRQTSSSYQDTDAAGAVYVTATNSVPTDQDVVVLYSIQSGSLIRHHSAFPATRNIYEEYYTVSGDHPAPYGITIPVDTRNGSAQAYYISGSGQLEIALNGQILRVGVSYSEGATAGAAYSTITMDEDLVDGDVLRFRLASIGGLYTVDSGSLVSLQQAYDQGNSINIVDGTPVTINASAGYKALQLNGDLGVTGVIDPTGLALTPQASNPLGSDSGIWIDTDGNLVQERVGEIPSSVNVTESILNPSTFLTAGDGIAISTATISANLDTNSGLEFNAAKIRVKLPTAGPLSRDSTGILVNLQSTSMEVSSSTLAVKVDPSSPITKGASGIGIAVDPYSVAVSNNQISSTNNVSVFNNNTGSTLSANSVVAADFTANQMILASSTTLSNAIKTIGVLATSVNDGSSGKVRTSGIVNVSSVGSLVVGMPVYLDPATPGSVISTRPTTYGQPVFMVGIAVSASQIVLQPTLITVNTNLYRETLVTGDISSGSSITLPVDSRAGGATRYYVVGQGYLSVYLNGQLLEIGAEGYLENGSSGSDSNSITINEDLVSGDRLEFRIEPGQAVAKAMLSL